MENSYNLEFRKLGLDDIDAYYDAFDANRRHFSEHDPDLGNSFHTLREVARELSLYSSKHRHHFGLFEDGELVGSSALFADRFNSAEVTYWVDREHTQRGIGRTACRLAINYGVLELGRRRFEANIFPTNIASIRIVSGLGFEHIESRERELTYELKINTSHN